MVLPTLIALTFTATCYSLLRLAAEGVIHPVTGIGLTLLVFWPLALAMALGADFIQKEHRLRERTF
ncbi:hypothetical protein ACLI4Z_03010 [Natrialbaceae archaeon A-arb3/5]